MAGVKAPRQRGIADKAGVGAEERNQGMEGGFTLLGRAQRIGKKPDLSDAGFRIGFLPLGVVKIMIGAENLKRRF